jgi:DNA-binding transcriptional MerR regulator
MAGDITTHKTVQRPEAKLNRTGSSKSCKSGNRGSVGRMNDAEKEAQKLRLKTVTSSSLPEGYKNYREHLNKQRRTVIQKVKELERSIETFQQQLDDMTEMLEEKDRQLKEQPIEVTAAKVEEVIPEELKQAVVDNVVSNINKLLHISAHEYRIFIEAGKADSEKYLDIIDDLLFFMQGIRKDIIQKG